MLKTLLSAVLAALLVHSLIGSQPALAASSLEEQSKLAVKVRNGIAKLGTGREACVAVKLKDKTKLAGYISEIREDSFTISNAGSGAETTVAYRDVTQIKGHNLSTGGKIAIGLGVLAAVLLILLIFENYG